MNNNFDADLLPQSRSSGFTLFELLVAILVLAVGLLGLATMQAQGLKSNNSAEKRTEATFLAMDIVDRMRSTMVANPIITLPPIVDGAFGAPATPVEINKGAMHACAGCSVAQQDLSDWATAVGIQLGGGAAAAVANAGWGAKIEQDNTTGTVIYIVTLMWDDQRTGATGTGCSSGAADMTCFQTLFRP